MRSILELILVDAVEPTNQSVGCGSLSCCMSTVTPLGSATTRRRLAPCDVCLEVFRLMIITTGLLAFHP